ncbi:MAG: hypothetical protein ACOC6F_02830, partial [bacterium]
EHLGQEKPVEGDVAGSDVGQGRPNGILYEDPETGVVITEDDVEETIAGASAGLARMLTAQPWEKHRHKFPDAPKEPPDR